MSELNRYAIRHKAAYTENIEDTEYINNWLDNENNINNIKSIIKTETKTIYPKNTRYNNILFRYPTEKNIEYCTNNNIKIPSISTIINTLNRLPDFIYTEMKNFDITIYPKPLYIKDKNNLNVSMRGLYLDNQIIIFPLISNELNILDTLLHELGHLYYDVTSEKDFLKKGFDKYKSKYLNKDVKYSTYQITEYFAYYFRKYILTISNP